MYVCMYMSEYHANMFIFYVCTYVFISFCLPLNPYLLKHPLLMSSTNNGNPTRRAIRGAEALYVLV